MQTPVRARADGENVATILLGAAGIVASHYLTRIRLWPCCAKQHQGAAMGSHGALAEAVKLLGPDLEAIAKRVFALYCGVGGNCVGGGGGDPAFGAGRGT